MPARRLAVLASLALLTGTLTSCERKSTTTAKVSPLDGGGEATRQYDAGKTDWKATVAEWKTQGWQEEEVLGEICTPVVMSAYATSETASLVSAIWKVNGEPQEKQYRQEEKMYLMLSFHCPNNTFVVVLSKPKP